MERETTKTRCAPGPAAMLHLGGTRTALFNRLPAKASGCEPFNRLAVTDPHAADS